MSNHINMLKLFFKINFNNINININGNGDAKKMKLHQLILTNEVNLAEALAPLVDLQPDLVLVFGAVRFFETPTLLSQLQRLLPSAALAGCSTAGEIAVDRVYDETCVITAVRFDRTDVHACSTIIDGMSDSFDAGQRLAAALPQKNLSAVLLLGTGVAINGSALVKGLQNCLPSDVTISGGLAADGGLFRRTWTLGPDGAADNRIVAVGLYGSTIRLGYGSFAGWEPFGPARKVTRCIDNVLFELDGVRALDIYQSYLGDYAKDLPASGLLFPFEMLGPQREKSNLFRTILGIDKVAGSLTLAGDIDPQGYLKLMHSSTEALIRGAETAAQAVLKANPVQPSEDGLEAPRLAILVSCVGRKLVMGERIDEEVEAVAGLLGKSTTVCGFYSNGEIAGSGRGSACHLHNQTMTIAWLSEVSA